MRSGRRVVCTIQHPAHVHFFRHAIRELRERDYEVRVLAREKDVAGALLEHYGIDHRRLAGSPETLPGLLAVQARYEWEVLRRVRRLRPAVVLGIGEPAVAHAGRLADARGVVFTDTEHAVLQNAVSLPLADRVYTPAAFRDDYGPSHRRYPGFHELAYLHPDRFEPDPTGLPALEGVDGPLVVVRLVAWNAAHDVGRGGVADVERAVDALEAFGATVRISAEGDLPPGLADRRAAIPPHRVHDLLASADLFLGESATMAIESCLLGTPALYVSDLRAGVLEALEGRYRLLRWLSRGTRPDEIVDHARALLRTDDAVWRTRRDRLLAETIDTTALVVDVVEELAGGGAPRDRPVTEVTPE